MIGLLGMSIFGYVILFYVVLKIFFVKTNEKEIKTILTAFFGGAFLILYLAFLAITSLFFESGFELWDLDVRIFLWGMLYVTLSLLYTGMVLSMNTYKRKYKIKKID